MRTDKAGEVFEDGSRIGDALLAMLAKGASLSGHERNKVFLLTRSGGALRYVDASILSGLDALGDGRAFAWLDVDHDGRRDVVLTNANEPRVQLFRNQVPHQSHVLAIRLEGAKRSSTSEPGGASNRDAIGTRVEVVMPERTHVTELRAGEGLAAQNSAELIVALGPSRTVEALRLTWPSGTKSEVLSPTLSEGPRSVLMLREP